MGDARSAEGRPHRRVEGGRAGLGVRRAREPEVGCVAARGVAAEEDLEVRADVTCSEAAWNQQYIGVAGPTGQMGAQVLTTGPRRNLGSRAGRLPCRTALALCLLFVRLLAMGQ